MLGVALAIAGTGQSVRAESLEEMLAAAQKYDGHYLAARADYESKVCQVGEAQSRFWPVLSVSGNILKKLPPEKRTISIIAKRNVGIMLPSTMAVLVQTSKRLPFRTALRMPKGMETR